MGNIMDLAVTSSALYLTMYAGEWCKVWSNNLTLVWGIKYGDLGSAIAISSDESVMFTSGRMATTTTFIGKLSTADGSVQSSLSTS